MYTTDSGAPVEDKSQDVELISGKKENGISTVVFKRKLNTCDKENDRVIKVSTIIATIENWVISDSLVQFLGFSVSITLGLNIRKAHRRANQTYAY